MATPLKRRAAPWTVVLNLVARVILDPIRVGRLRDGGWPYGLRAVVAVGCTAYAAGAIVVATSSLIRRNGELTVPGSLTTSLPRGYVWLLILLVLVSLAMFQTAALHAVWWLRLLATLTSVLVMATWGFRYNRQLGGLLEAVLTGAFVVGLIVLVSRRARRTFAWWEFPVVLAILASPVALGLELLGRTSRPLGFDFAPVYLQAMVTTLGPIALPAAVVAGLSVAEITVSATVWATRMTETRAVGRSAYAILAVLVALRLVQAVVELVSWDFVQQGWNVFATWVLLAALLGVLSALVIRLGRAHPPVVVSKLPDRLARMALPLATAMVGLGFVGAVILSVFAILTALNPTGMAAVPSSMFTALSSATGPNIFRSLMGVVLVVVALLLARRGRTGTGLLLCGVAVMLWARVVRWASGGELNAGYGAGALNLVATAVLVGLLARYLIRRTLTVRRAVTLSSAVVLSALLGSHDFISDPVGALLGFSGAGLVLFGLTWNLLTDSDFANRGSVRFPIPSRVMLLLANFILAMAILAYTSMARDPGATISLDDFATLGDEVLGTALLAAAFVGVLSAAQHSRQVD